jgi:hypothetical protein
MNDHKEETRLNAWHMRQVIAAVERTANQGAAVEAIGKALAVLLTWREGEPELQQNNDQEHRDGRPLVRTGTAWRRWAAKLATEATRRDGCTWAAVVAWIEHRNAYRITLAGQPER